MSAKKKSAPKAKPGLNTVKPTETLDFERVDLALCKKAAKFGSATIHEAAGKVGALPSGIKGVSPKFRISGPAFTVQGPPDALDELTAAGSAPNGHLTLEQTAT